MSSRELAAGGGRRRVLVLVALLGLLLPYGLVLAQLWSSTTTDLSFARSERDGVAYLKPLVRLIAATADAQSAAVAGTATDGTALRDAQAAVAAVDARLGASLGTRDRWTQLSSRLDAVVAGAPTGRAAWTAFTQVTDLEIALARAVGDSSNLILDPALDSYYVMDATLLRVPALLVGAGRLSDRAAIGGDDVFVATARAQVRSDAAAIDSGLGKGFATTRSRTLGAELLPALDRLRAAVSRLAPATADLGGTVTATAAQDAQARGQVRDAAIALGATGLDQLDALLATRASDLDRRRLIALGTALAGALLALGAWWLSGPRPGRGRVAAEDDADELDDDGDGTGGPDAGDGADEFDDLLEARELLESRQLVRVGRAVAPQRKTRS